MTETLEQTIMAYDVWLDRQPLAPKTRVAYRIGSDVNAGHLSLEAVSPLSEL